MCAFLHISSVGKSYSEGPDCHAIRFYGCVGELHRGQVPEHQLVIPRCREKTVFLGDLLSFGLLLRVGLVLLRRLRHEFLGNRRSSSNTQKTIHHMAIPNQSFDKEIQRVEGKNEKGNSLLSKSASPAQKPNLCAYYLSE